MPCSLYTLLNEDKDGILLNCYEIQHEVMLLSVKTVNIFKDT